MGVDHLIAICAASAVWAAIMYASCKTMERRIKELVKDNAELSAQREPQNRNPGNPYDTGSDPHSGRHADPVL